MRTLPILALTALAFGPAAKAEVPDAAGWLRLGGSDRATFYFRDIRPVADHRTVWLRAELAKPDTTEKTPFSSFATIVEFDCQGRKRNLQTTAYEGNQLLGNSNTTSGDPAWSYVVPETVEQALEKVACR